nr:Spy/CpxP family protein refolding chaperone [uncultured Desulfuromonas sp.]
MKTKLRIIVLAVLVMAASQTAWARQEQGSWDGPPGPGQGRGMGMMACDMAPLFPPHLLPMMTVALDLTSEQIVKITTLEEAMRNTFQKQHDLKAEQRKLMMPAAEKKDFDAKALRKNLEALLEQEVDLLVKRAQLRDDLTHVLTEEQQGKCQAIMKSMMPPAPRRDGDADEKRDRRGPAEHR